MTHIPEVGVLKRYYVYDAKNRGLVGMAMVREIDIGCMFMMLMVMVVICDLLVIMRVIVVVVAVVVVMNMRWSVMMVAMSSLFLDITQPKFGDCVPNNTPQLTQST